MAFKLLFTKEANENLEELEKGAERAKQLKAVRKALGYLEANPRHPSLNTHKFASFRGGSGEEVFEAYAENRTASASRIFWHYGPGKDTLTIIAIVPHP